MPELPEVEIVRRTLEGKLKGEVVADVVLRRRNLRWPIPAELISRGKGQRIISLGRRAKYLLLELEAGTVVMHLGMSGRITLVDGHTTLVAHDHVDLTLGSGKRLRFNDPRRFGAILWADEVARHPLLRDLGPEPLQPDFDGTSLYQCSRGRRCSVKSFLLDGRVVAGIGNIYAAEVLFDAGIHPTRQAGRISSDRYLRLGTSIQRVLGRAITAGGTTIRDFVNGVGEQGDYGSALSVYGRAGLPCLRCGRALREHRINQRTTVYCPGCQR